MRIAFIFWVLVASVALILLTERFAERAAGIPLAWWRRLMIPLPTLLFLSANIDSILSLGAYLDTHHAAPFRYVGQQAWDTGRFYIAGLAAAAFLPFLLASRFRGLATLAGEVLCAHFLWLIFAFYPLLLATGMPLRQ